MAGLYLQACECFMLKDSVLPWKLLQLLVFSIDFLLPNVLTST